MTLTEKLQRWKEVARARSYGGQWTRAKHPLAVQAGMMHLDPVIPETEEDAAFIVLSDATFEALLDCASALDGILRSEALKEAPFYGYSEAVLNATGALKRLSEIEG